MYGVNGGIIVPRAAMPAMNGGGHLTWDAANGNVFYDTLGNSVMQGTISGSSVTALMLHTFAEY